MRIARLAALVLLVVTFSAKAQAPGTVTWTNKVPSQACQYAQGGEYSCYFYGTDGAELHFFVMLQPNGSFTNGTFARYSNGVYEFSATNWTGWFANNTLSGVFSGVNANGTVYNGSASAVIGLVKGPCNRWGQCGSNPGVVGGGGTVTIN
jgi:hypothetical protein